MTFTRQRPTISYNEKRLRNLNVKSIFTLKRTFFSRRSYSPKSLRRVNYEIFVELYEKTRTLSISETMSVVFRSYFSSDSYILVLSLRMYEFLSIVMRKIFTLLLISSVWTWQYSRVPLNRIYMRFRWPYASSRPVNLRIRGVRRLLLPGNILHIRRQLLAVR